MQSKKIKIFTSICIPVIALGSAGALIGINLNRDNPSPVLPDGDFIITYRAGENGKFGSEQKQQTRVYAGTHLSEAYQPMVESLDASLGFTGWVDENNQPFYSKERINRNITLTATYGAVTGDYCEVTFDSSDPGVLLQGNLKVAVKKGYRFFMVNRPQASTLNKVFTGWALASDPTHQLPENYKFTESTTLVPMFSEQLLLTWNGHGATKTRGSDTSKVVYGDTFGLVNQPNFVYDGKYFAGWFKDENYTQEWTSSTPISEDCTAHAKWIDQPSETQCSITYQQKPNTSIAVSFSIPNQVVSKLATWNSFNKPTVITTTGDYVVDHWEYTQTPAVEESWQRVEDSTTFNMDSVYVAPIMKPYVEDVVIIGENNVLTQTSTQFTSYVFGCESKSVTWNVYDDEQCQTLSTIASISAGGLLNVNFINTEGKTIYVKATSQVDPTVYRVMPVSVLLPYQNSFDVWYEDGTDWFKFDQDEIHKISETYTLTKVNGDTTWISSYAPFEHKIYIGRKTNKILDNFFIGFTGFNGTIDFEESNANSRNNVKYIGNSFLEGCTTFNKYLYLANIESIGDNFLFGCLAFNNGYLGAEGEELKPLDLSSNSTIQSLGNNFLDGCQIFNQEIKLPNNSALTSIGEYFMFNCKKFNKPINLPATLTSIKPFFMLNCYSFTNVITVNCTADAFLGNDQQICATSATFVDPVTSETVDSEIYSTGFAITGTYKYDFANKFPNTASEERHVFRKSKTGQELHILSATSELDHVEASFDKPYTDENQQFTLTINNQRTEAVSDWDIELTVGQQHKIIKQVSALPVGKTNITYTKVDVNAMLDNPMGIDDDITFNLVRTEYYSVANNKLYYTDASKQTSLVSDDDITSLAGQFLIKNKYNEYRLNGATTFVQFLANAKANDANDVTLISGLYDTLSSDPSELITLKLHGIVDSNNNKTATLNTYAGNDLKVITSNIKYQINCMKMVGYLGEDGYHNFVCFGITCPGLICNNCDFRGGYTLYTANAQFNNCTFDSRDMYYMEGGIAKNIYPMFIYGNYSYATFNNCIFNSGGKALKIYSDDDLGNDLTTTISNCSFIYDGTYTEEVSPSVKSPLEVESTYLAQFNFYIYVHNNTMTNYPEGIPFANLEGDHAFVYEF